MPGACRHDLSPRLADPVPHLGCLADLAGDLVHVDRPGDARVDVPDRIGDHFEIDPASGQDGYEGVPALPRLEEAAAGPGDPRGLAHAPEAMMDLLAVHRAAPAVGEHQPGA